MFYFTKDCSRRVHSHASVSRNSDTNLKKRMRLNFWKCAKHNCPNILLKLRAYSTQKEESNTTVTNEEVN